MIIVKKKYLRVCLLSCLFILQSGAPGGSQYCPGTISSSSGPGNISSCSLLPNALFLAHFTSLTTGKDSSPAVTVPWFFWTMKQYNSSSCLFLIPFISFWPHHYLWYCIVHCAIHASWLPIMFYKFLCYWCFPLMQSLPRVCSGHCEWMMTCFLVILNLPLGSTAFIHGNSSSNYVVLLG